VIIVAVSVFFATPLFADQDQPSSNRSTGYSPHFVALKRLNTDNSAPTRDGSTAHRVRPTK
tara:strand:- start:342 stop:524 length:183 start_codon:yes stop_codon:yes gene_type:complete